jgi:hypothetical protein
MSKIKMSKLFFLTSVLSLFSTKLVSAYMVITTSDLKAVGEAQAIYLSEFVNVFTALFGGDIGKAVGHLAQSLPLFGVFLLIYIVGKYSAKVTIFRKDEFEKYANIFGWGLALIGIASPVFGLIVNLFGNSLLTIIFFLLFIFMIIMMWNTLHTSNAMSRKDLYTAGTENLHAKGEYLKAEHEFELQKKELIQKKKEISSAKETNTKYLNYRKEILKRITSVETSLVEKFKKFKKEWESRKIPPSTSSDVNNCDEAIEKIMDYFDSTFILQTDLLNQLLEELKNISNKLNVNKEDEEELNKALRELDAVLNDNQKKELDQFIDDSKIDKIEIKETDITPESDAEAKEIVKEAEGIIPGKEYPSTSKFKKIAEKFLGLFGRLKSKNKNKKEKIVQTGEKETKRSDFFKNIWKHLTDWNKSPTLKYGKQLLEWLKKKYELLDAKIKLKKEQKALREKQDEIIVKIEQEIQTNFISRPYLQSDKRNYDSFEAKWASDDRKKLTPEQSNDMHARLNSGMTLAQWVASKRENVALAEATKELTEAIEEAETKLTTLAKDEVKVDDAESALKEHTYRTSEEIQRNYTRNTGKIMSKLKTLPNSHLNKSLLKHDVDTVIVKTNDPNTSTEEKVYEIQKLATVISKIVKEDSKENEELNEELNELEKFVNETIKEESKSETRVIEQSGSSKDDIANAVSSASSIMDAEAKVEAVTSKKMNRQQRRSQLIKKLQNNKSIPQMQNKMKNQGK